MIVLLVAMALFVVLELLAVIALFVALGHQTVLQRQQEQIARDVSESADELILAARQQQQVIARYEALVHTLTETQP